MKKNKNNIGGSVTTFFTGKAAKKLNQAINKELKNVGLMTQDGKIKIKKLSIKMDKVL